ncbi:MAG TPA: tetratricopeptide repeat protein, partial [Chitinophagaceae bacterium]|nr:tetratricopeptide repeat protein [Chitinophagaceae bacterium]
MEADRKRLAEAMQKLNEKTSKMDPNAKKGYDSLLNVFGVGQKMDNAVKQVNSNQTTKSGPVSNGLIPAKDTKAIAGIAATPSAGNMGVYIVATNDKVFTAALPAAKNKANEIYAALKAKHISPAQMGNASAALWMEGRTQVALCVMAQACKDDPANTDNLSNYASMLHAMGAPELAIPILNNLDARFKNNSTILNNLGQAWFALGDVDRANKYLDSTLLIAAAHPQAHETKCLIEESKGNKTAAVSHARAAFKQGKTSTRADRLRQLGYTPGAGDYNNFPPANKSDDLLNLGGFSMPPFPKSVEEGLGLRPVWKQFKADVDQRLKPLQKMTDESNKETV